MSRHKFECFGVQSPSHDWPSSSVPPQSTRTHITVEMTSEREEYVAVLKALYDYDPSSQDELAIKEDQLLFLVEKTDDE